MGFGMGCCCLQSTFSTKGLEHARYLYDQLAIWSPLFLALTAGSPIFNGILSDWDTRWDVISASVDCRTEEERNIQSNKYIPKSRYSSISYFISDRKSNLKEYNDVKFPLNKDIMDYAKEKAVEMNLTLDDQLLQHLGFLF